MKYTDSDLSRWLHAAHAALAENEVECVATSLQGRAEIRTPAGAIVTAWSSGKVSAGGPEAPRDAALTILHSSELLVGYRARATGGMLLQLPSGEPVESAPVSRQADVTPQELRRASEFMRAMMVRRRHEGGPAAVECARIAARELVEEARRLEKKSA